MMEAWALNVIAGLLVANLGATLRIWYLVGGMEARVKNLEHRDHNYWHEVRHAIEQTEAPAARRSGTR